MFMDPPPGPAKHGAATVECFVRNAKLIVVFVWIRELQGARREGDAGEGSGEAARLYHEARLAQGMCSWKRSRQQS